MRDSWISLVISHLSLVIIILTSDGVVEANNAAGEMFGFEQLEEVIKTGPTNSAEAVLNHLKQAVLTFIGEVEQHDDITIVVIQI